jgi:pSer/pThr/pTyr-binding forkhead associated (FHA) protein
VVLSNTQDCVIEDLNSTNGVLVNGRRVGRQSLRDGDSLLIGNTTFTFQQFE